MPDGDEYLDEPGVRNKDRQFPYEPPPAGRYEKRRGADHLSYIPPAEMAALDFVPFGADGVGHPGYRQDPPPPVPAAEAERVEELAADVLLDRAVEEPAAAPLTPLQAWDAMHHRPRPAGPPDPEALRQLREAWIMSLSSSPRRESLADRLKREAREAADQAALANAKAQVKLEQQAADAEIRANLLLDQLQSLEGVWLGNVPKLEYGANSSTRLGRYQGQLAVRGRKSVWDNGGFKYTRHEVRLVLECPNSVSLPMLEWSTGWVNPRGNHTGNPYHTAGWVIDDYNTAMSDKPPMLAGQAPRTEEAAINLTLDFLRKFVLPDPPPPPPTEPTVEPGRPGLDL